MHDLHDPEVELAILGGLLGDDVQRAALFEDVTLDDFGLPESRQVFQAIEWLHRKAQPVTPIRVVDVVAELLATKVPIEFVERAQAGRAPSAQHLARLFDLAERRAAIGSLTALAGRARDPDVDPFEFWDEMAAAADRRRQDVDDVRLDVEPASAFWSDDPIPVDWLIPGVMERHTRAIFVGPSGYGKTYLLRLIAFCCSQGMHPFTEAAMRPLRTLVVELENSRTTVELRLQEIRRAVVQRMNARQMPVDRSRFRTLPVQRNVNLLAKADVRKLHGTLAEFRPDLLVLGPVYRMYQGTGRPDMGGEGAATAAQAVLDDIVSRFNVGLLLEAHTPKSDLQTVRGSSAWVNWPDYGYAMIPKGPDHAWLEQLRGDRGDGRWPDALTRNDPRRLPWFPSARRES